MATLWKAALAALAGATAISAGATHDRHDNSYGYSYDRYGNVYSRPDYDRYRTYDGRVCVRPVPLVDPNLEYCDPDPRAREYYSYTPAPTRELELRRQLERVQRGDFDETSTHPLSKNYSPG